VLKHTEAAPIDIMRNIFHDYINRKNDFQAPKRLVLSLPGVVKFLSDKWFLAKGNNSE